MGFGYGGGKSRKDSIVKKIKTKLSSKKESDPWKELSKKIKGLGGKRLDDLKEAYDGDYSALEKAVKDGNKIPIRDDIEEDIKSYLSKE